MKNLLIRAATGTVFVAAVIGSTWYSPWAFGLLFGAFMILGQWELYKLAEKDGAHAHKLWGILSGMFLFAAVFALNTQDNPAGLEYPHIVRTLVISGLCLFIPFLIELFRKRKTPFRNVGWTALGVLYVALPFSLMNALLISYGDIYYAWLLLGFFFIIWANDTGAYCVGRLLGKAIPAKLFERVSPNKTWVGSLGGLLFGLGAAYGLSYLDMPERFTMTTEEWLIMGAITVVFGSLGDLVESRLKRSLNVKDTGKILPGHGGILDRFDAAIFAIPFVFAYLMIFVF